MLAVILGLIIAVNAVALFYTVRDLQLHREDIRQAKGPLPLQMLTSFLLYFFGAFGISDFALSTVVYNKTGWVSTKKLPGTLNTQPLVAVLVMALAYISSIEIEMLTLIPFLLLQMLGSLIGPRISVRLHIPTLKYLMSASLLIAGLFILSGKLGWFNIQGVATGLHGWKLIFIWLFGLLMGIIKALGIGAYPLTMVAVYMLGLNPLLTYPLMMGASSLSLPAASFQFVRLDAYSRRITLCGLTAGLVGALIAVFLVKSMNVSLLQWVVLAVVLFAAIDMFSQARRGNSK